VLAAEAGDDYLFVLDGRDALPDPCSRSQPAGVRGPSRIVDTTCFEIAEARRLRLEALVLSSCTSGPSRPREPSTP
jgi:1,4-alpha-glucan branching enzyme